MLRCANCQSAAVMPKSGLCLACGFVAGVEKYQKDEQSLSTDIPELNNTVETNTDTKASEQESISDVLGEESLALSEEETSLTETHEQERLINIPELDNTEDSNTDTKASEREKISDVLDEENLALSLTLSEEENSLADNYERKRLIDILELDNVAEINADTKAYEQENISGVLAEESLASSEKETSLIEAHEQEHLINIPELDNTEDSNTDTKVSERESIPNTLNNEKTTLSISVENHQTKVDDFDWDKSIPPFLQVTHKAKLKKSYTRIIESCQKDLEPLKGSLVSKGDGTARSFMVSSTYRKEGVTTSALAVSIALSRFGHSKVLLVDANAVAPSLHEAFSLTDCPGFIDYISGADVSINKKSTVHSIYQEMEEATRADNAYLWAKYAYYTEYKGLYVMPYALTINNSSLWDVVESTNFNNKLEQLKQAFDYIVFDAPAILGSSEPALLSQYIEGVILVIEAEKTKWEVTELAVSNVRNSGGTFVGAILNKRKFYIPRFLYRWI